MFVKTDWLSASFYTPGFTNNTSGPTLSCDVLDVVNAFSVTGYLGKTGTLYFFVVLVVCNECLFNAVSVGHPPTIIQILFISRMRSSHCWKR